MPNQTEPLFREQVAAASPRPRWVSVAAELKEPVKDQLVTFGRLATIDHRRFYPTLDTAIGTVRPEARP